MYLNWLEIRHILENHNLPKSKCNVCELFNIQLDKYTDEYIKKFIKIFCVRCDNRIYCNKNLLNNDSPDCKKYLYFINLY